MRFELIDIRACQTVDDVKNLVKISSDAFQNLMVYANNLLVEASVVLNQLKDVEGKWGPLGPKLIEAKEIFTRQESEMKNFFALCNKAGIIVMKNRPTSKRSLKEIVAKSYFKE